MILIKITKENREPEVGEWYYEEGSNYVGKYDEIGLITSDCKSLSLSVILDAPDDPKDLIWAREAYPISNSEEIFQWLHDHGKLGEEWVEWEGKAFSRMDGSVELLLPAAKFADLSYTRDNPSPIHLLRKLADLQNGPPLERYRKEWEETMKEVYECLEKNEC